MKKSIIAAGAASVALAAMPIVGVFADGDIQSVTDTITVTVSPSCTFNTIEGGASAADTSYAGTGTNGQSVTFNNSGLHTFNVFCNKNSGYTVSATAHDLKEYVAEGSVTGINDVFAYKATLPTSESQASAKANGAWHAAFAGDGTSAERQLPDSSVPQGESEAVASATIVTRSEASGAGGETFTATYTAWIGTETPAASYRGQIAYTLTPGA